MADSYLVPAYQCTLVRDASRDVFSQNQINGSSAAINLAVEMIGNSPVEQLVVFMLDTKNRVIGTHVASIGIINAAFASPREIFRTAILLNCASIIIAHNHPSGELTPSREDMLVFERLQDAGRLLGIDCLDSVIVNHLTGRSLQE